MTHDLARRRDEAPGRRLDLGLDAERARQDDREGTLERHVEQPLARAGGGPTPSEAPKLPKRDLHDLAPGTTAPEPAMAAMAAMAGGPVYGNGTPVYDTGEEPDAASAPEPAHVEAVPAWAPTGPPPRRAPDLAERAGHALAEAQAAPGAIADEVRASLHEVMDEARKAVLGGIAGAFLAFMALGLFSLAAAFGLNRAWGGENGFLAIGGLYAVLAAAAMLVALRGARGVRREAVRGADQVKAEVSDRARAIAAPPPRGPGRY